RTLCASSRNAGAKSKRNSRAIALSKNDNASRLKLVNALKKKSVARLRTMRLPAPRPKSLGCVRWKARGAATPTNRLVRPSRHTNQTLHLCDKPKRHDVKLKSKHDGALKKSPAFVRRSKRNFALRQPNAVRLKKKLDARRKKRHNDALKTRRIASPPNMHAAWLRPKSSVARKMKL